MQWYDIRQARGKLRAFNVIIGGRGIGKTYSAISFLMEEGEPFIYMRNTDVQIKESSTAFGNPFKKWNRDYGRDVKILKEGHHSVIVEKDKNLGYAVPLSTFENLRGVDLSDVKYVLFEEFSERRALSFRQFDTFANFYETANRNRELLGEDPLKVIMLSNAQKLDNPILANYGFIPIIENMLLTGDKERIGRHYYIALPESDVSEAKRGTANYQLAKDTFFAQKAIENKFAYDSFYGVKKRPLREYVPVCSIDDIYIYRHKSTGRYYASSSQSNTSKHFTRKDTYALFMKTYGLRFQMAEAVGKFDYEDFTIKSKLSGLIG